MLHECITSKNAPKAIGPYSPAVKLGDMIFMSGQLPIVPETGELISDSIEEQTAQCLRNLEAILKDAGLSLQYVLKTTVYMTDLSEFGKMNEVYGQFFSEPYPARCAAEVSGLAKGARMTACSVLTKGLIARAMPRTIVSTAHVTPAKIPANIFDLLIQDVYKLQCFSLI